MFDHICIGIHHHKIIVTIFKSVEGDIFVCLSIWEVQLSAIAESITSFHEPLSLHWRSMCVMWKCVIFITSDPLQTHLYLVWRFPSLNLWPENHSIDHCHYTTAWIHHKHTKTCLRLILKCFGKAEQRQCVITCGL